MKRTFVSLLAVLLLVLAPIPMHAQIAQGTLQPTQQSATHADAATAVAQSNTSASTITITNTTGGYIYITAIDITNCAGASAVTAAAPTFVTVTGITGPPKYMVGSGVGAGLCQPSAVLTFGNGGIRSTAPGTAVTFVLPTFATNQTVSVNVYYYYAL